MLQYFPSCWQDYGSGTGPDRGFVLAGILIKPLTIPVPSFTVASSLILKQYNVLRAEHFTLMENGENVW